MERRRCAKKAGGDHRKGNNLDPYAYVPLDPSNMNRRKRHKAARAFDTVIKAAKRGAQRGKKLKKVDGGRRQKGRR